MDRRNLFRIIGATAAAEPLEAFQRAIPYSPKFFTPEEAFTAQRVADILIPADSKSGGAEAAGVIKYMDLTVHYGGNGVQQTWRRGIGAVEKDAKDRFGKSFRQLDRSQQEKIVAAMAENEGKRNDALGRFFLTAKRLTMEAYHFSSLHWKQYMGRGMHSALSEFPGCKHKDHA